MVSPWTVRFHQKLSILYFSDEAIHGSPDYDRKTDYKCNNPFKSLEEIARDL